MMDAAQMYQMVSGIGKGFGDSYESSRKQALATDLGEKVKSGDFAGAADTAFKGGDINTGLSFLKLGESRGASKALSDALGPLFGGAGASGGAAPAADDGLVARMGRAYRTGTSSGAIEPFKTDDPVAEGLLPHQKALLNGIAGPESAGRYNVRFTPRGGALFDSFTQHPGIAEMGPSGPSTAAGRYQFTKSTWDGMGGGDFSPANQDRRALQLAAQDYRSRTGRDLDADLQSEGFSPRIQQVLAPTWTGLGGNQERSAATYADSLKRYGSGGATAVAAADPPPLGLPSAQAATAGDPAAPAEGSTGRLPTRYANVLDSPQGSIEAPQAVGSLPGRAVPQAAPTAPQSAPTAPVATAPAVSPVLASMPQMAQLASARVPLPVVASVGRTAPGSPERVGALIRASLIPGLNEQQQGVVKTLLASELDQTKSLTSDQREYAQGVTQGFKGTLQDWKQAQRPDRVKYLQGRDGRQYAVDPDNLDGGAREIKLPGEAGVRVWGSTGPDGQVVQPPPNAKQGAAGYYKADGTPEYIDGKGQTINLPAAEGEEAKKLGGLRAERAGALEAAAAKAPEQIGKLNLLSTVLDRASTGTLGPLQSKVVGFAQSLGIPDATIAGLGLNPQQAVTAEVATKLINESVVGMIGSGGFPANNFSNTDREFLTDIFPKMSNRPEANRLAIDVLKRVQQRNLEVGDAWAEYQSAQREAGKPASVAEFEFNVRKGLRDKPDLFAGLREQVEALPKGGASTSGEGSAGGPGRFDPATATISMEDGKALKNAPDTEGNRRLFDERYGAGAAEYVLKRPLAGAGGASTADKSDASKPLPKGKDRIEIPGGQSSAAAVAEAKSLLATARPDQRAKIVERLRSWGIDPGRLDEGSEGIGADGFLPGP